VDHEDSTGVTQEICIALWKRDTKALWRAIATVAKRLFRNYEQAEIAHWAPKFARATAVFRPTVWHMNRKFYTSKKRIIRHELASQLDLKTTHHTDP
jgi:hypothetical protein